MAARHRENVGHGCASSTRNVPGLEMGDQDVETGVFRDDVEASLWEGGAEPTKVVGDVEIVGVGSRALNLNVLHRFPKGLEGRGDLQRNPLLVKEFSQQLPRGIPVLKVAGHTRTRNTKSSVSISTCRLRPLTFLLASQRRWSLHSVLWR